MAKIYTKDKVDELLRNVDGAVREFAPGVSYSNGDLVRHDGAVHECVSDRPPASDWNEAKASFSQIATAKDLDSCLRLTDATEDGKMSIFADEGMESFIFKTPRGGSCVRLPIYMNNGQNIAMVRDVSNIVNDMIGFENYDPSTSEKRALYKVGAVVVHDSSLWKCVESAVEDTEWVRSHWEKTTVDKIKQDSLVDGINIKTVNGQSILGEGNIVISGGEAIDVPSVADEIIGNERGEDAKKVPTVGAVNARFATKTDAISRLGGIIEGGLNVGWDGEEMTGTQIDETGLAVWHDGSVMSGIGYLGELTGKYISLSGADGVARTFDGSVFTIEGSDASSDAKISLPSVEEGDSVTLATTDEVGAAVLKAGDAHVAAAAADSKADSARTAASSALDVASSAKSVAEEAQVSADSASASADLAVKIAEENALSKLAGSNLIVIKEEDEETATSKYKSVTYAVNIDVLHDLADLKIEDADFNEGFRKIVGSIPREIEFAHVNRFAELSFGYGWADGGGETMTASFVARIGGDISVSHDGVNVSIQEANAGCSYTKTGGIEIFSGWTFGGNGIGYKDENENSIGYYSYNCMIPGGGPKNVTLTRIAGVELTPVYEWTLGNHNDEFLFRNISATYNEDEKGWDTSEEMSQDGGVTWQTATVPASDNPDPDRSATSVTCVSATFNRTIIGYRLGTSATAPILVPVTEKTGEETGAKTYELPEPIKTTLFTEAAFKQAVADKVSEMYDNAEEVRYPCYGNAEITAY